MSSAAEQFRKESLARWESLLRRMFPEGVPTNRHWSDRDEIIRVLDTIGSVEAANHTLSPSGGGLDLAGAVESAEAGCVDLKYVDSNNVDVVKPMGLSFESFGDDKLEWAYFRLETGGLKPSGVYESVFSETHEELTDLGGGHYVDKSVTDQGFYGYDENDYERPLPPEARPVMRYFKGAFVIVAKTSIYNDDPATYDARHNEMTGEQFRRYIERNIKLIDEERSKQGGV